MAHVHAGEHLPWCHADHDDLCNCEEHRYEIGLCIALVVFVAQVIGGWISGGTAILADSAHVFMDGAGYVISIYVSRTVVLRHDKDGHRVFWSRVSNALVLVALLWICVEATGRLLTPTSVHGGTLIWFALAGLAGNALQLWIAHGNERNPTQDSQVRHIKTDLGTSIVVIVGSVVVALKPTWTAVDPLLSLMLVVVIGFDAIRRIINPLRHNH